MLNKKLTLLILTVCLIASLSSFATDAFVENSPALWENLYRVTQSDGHLSLTSTDHGAALSLNKLGPNEDGWFEFEIADASSIFYIGFSQTSLPGYSLQNFAYVVGVNMDNQSNKVN